MPKLIPWGLALVWLLNPPLRADEPKKPTAPASEANPAVPAAGHSIHGEAFDDGPRQKAYLMPGQGKIDFPVSAAKPEAQAFINQGVGQLHSFFYLEAERSFRTAAQIDPACPMAYWGMAMANVNNPKRAKGFLKEAEAKAKASRSLPANSSTSTRWTRCIKDGVDAKTQKKISCSASRRSSRSSPATSTPAPGWRW